MGVILSIIGVTTASVKKIRDKRKAKKIRKASDPQDETRNKPQPLDPVQAIAVEGLLDEHLAAVSPPIPGQSQTTEGVQAERRAETLGANTNSPPTKIPPAKNESGKMASDEDYAAFLDKANADPNEGVSKTQSSGNVQLKAVDEGVEIPASLKKVTEDAFYISDSDEPFKTVGLKLKGKGLPDEAAFAKLVNHPNSKDAEVVILDIGEWDSQGQYKDLVEATREATKGSDVRVYRIMKDRSRVEYWVVGAVDGKLLGVKALAIES